MASRTGFPPVDSQWALKSHRVTAACYSTRSIQISAGRSLKRRSKSGQDLQWDRDVHKGIFFLAFCSQILQGNIHIEPVHADFREICRIVRNIWHVFFVITKRLCGRRDKVGGRKYIFPGISRGLLNQWFPIDESRPRSRNVAKCFLWGPHGFGFFKNIIKLELYSVIPIFNVFSLPYMGEEGSQVIWLL